MTNWHDPAIVHAEDGSLTFLPSEQSIYVALLFSRSRQVHACPGWYLHVSYTQGSMFGWLIICHLAGSFYQTSISSTPS